MPHLYSKYVYIVMTLTDQITKESMKKLNSYFQENTEKSLCVSETGMNGDNPHLNIVAEFKNDQRMTRINQLMKTYYPKDFIKPNKALKIYDLLDDRLTTTKYLIKSKPMYNETNLIGGYLEKENDHRIIWNKGYDLKKIIDTWQKQQSFLGYSKPRKVGFVEAPHFFYFYLTNQKKKITRENLIDAYTHLSCEGFSFVAIKKNFYDIYLEVRNLDGKPHLLKADLLDILENKGQSRTIVKNIFKAS